MLTTFNKNNLEMLAKRESLLQSTFSNLGISHEQFNGWAKEKYHQANRHTMIEMMKTDDNDIVSELKSDFTCLICFGFVTTNANQCLECEKIICPDCFN